jgi:hypothetical protein
MDIKEFLQQKLRKILRVGPLTISGLAGLSSIFIFTFAFALLLLQKQ